MLSRRAICNAPAIFMARASDRIIPRFLAIAGKYPKAIHAKRSIAMTPKKQCITIDNINPHLRSVEYFVRSPIVLRADAIAKELSEGQAKPFNEVIRAHFGDSHAMGQVPITFVRQVLALVTYPELLIIKGDHFPEDVKQKARSILSNCKGGSVGSYTEIPGIESIRRHVATFIQERDGFPSHWSNIVLTAGASGAIKSVLKLIVCDVDGKRPGCMIPIPQYPLYSATLAEFNIAQVGYYLDESKNWGLTMSELERSLTEARKTCNPRALAIINPGNPTGQVLTKENIQEIIKFAYKENLFILADEVYQHNVFAEGSEFHSFKKVMMELGAPYNTMELASFMSCSKGYTGECGIRGAYVELINLCPQVKAIYMKAISAALCPTALGQAVMDCVAAPPKKGDLSYELFTKERDGVLEPLKEKARIISETFNSIPGISCNPVQGAMYAFPQLFLPPKAIAAAENKGMHPDSFYATELLEKTGICVVPGSGFGQKPGTYHFRTNILMKNEIITDMFQKFSKFHREFLEEYK